MIFAYIAIYFFVIFVVFKLSADVFFKGIFGLRGLTFLLLFAEIPYLVSVAANQSSLHPQIIRNMYDFEGVFIKFLIYKAIFVVFFASFALSWRVKPNLSLRLKEPNRRDVTRNGRLDIQFSILMLFLTVLTFWLFLQKVGGLGYLLLNWSNKTEVLSGTALLRVSNLTFGILSIGFFINYIGSRSNIKIHHILFLIFLVSFSFLIFLSLGERKNPILVVLFSMISWNYRVSRIRIFSPLNIFLLVFFMAFAALFPELRKSGAMDLFRNQPEVILLASLEHWGQIFSRISDLDTSLFVYSTFTSMDDFWLGSSWPSLLTGLIPSSLFPSKPPIDEGVYIYALAHGFVLSPPVPFADLISVGWPLSRVTGPYVHFGIIGVVVGAMLTGIVVRAITRSTMRSKSPASLFVYAWVMFTGFGLTNAYLFNLAIIVAIIFPFHLLYIKLERRN